jgi:hypothetical protein
MSDTGCRKCGFHSGAKMLIAVDSVLVEKRCCMFCNASMEPGDDVQPDPETRERLERIKKLVDETAPPRWPIMLYPPTTSAPTREGE